MAPVFLGLPLHWLKAMAVRILMHSAVPSKSRALKCKRISRAVFKKNYNTGCSANILFRSLFVTINSRLAFVFSGQGSQKVGMLAEVAAEFPIVQKTFAEASNVLGYDLWDLCQNGEQEQLNSTEITQPLLLTSSVALWRVWQEKNGAQPVLFAGHSLGEWSALVCSGVVAFADAVDLVRKRGAYMQTAVPKGEGSMAAVLNLEDAIILDICKQASVVGVVEAVNFNSPGQVVIAGQVAAVDKASELLKAAGAKRVLPLPVSAPFHTSLMKPAAEQMAAHITTTVFNAPQIPVIHNVHA